MIGTTRGPSFIWNLWSVVTNTASRCKTRSQDRAAFSRGHVYTAGCLKAFFTGEGFI